MVGAPVEFGRSKAAKGRTRPPDGPRACSGLQALAQEATGLPATGLPPSGQEATGLPAPQAAAAA